MALVKEGKFTTFILLNQNFMNARISRRDWFRSALVAGAGIPLSLSFANELMAAPASEAERAFGVFKAGGKLIRLGSNENPYGPSAKAREAIKASVGDGNRYGFDQSDEIKKMIADGGGLKGGGNNANCPTDYPSLSLKGASLSADAKSMLAAVATKLKDNPDCTITLTAYPKADKRSQSLADKKLEAVKNYLVEKLGISADRIATDKVIDGGDANTIDIK